MPSPCSSQRELVIDLVEALINFLETLVDLVEAVTEFSVMLASIVITSSTFLLSVFFAMDHFMSL